MTPATEIRIYIVVLPILVLFAFLLFCGFTWVLINIVGVLVQQLRNKKK